MKVVSSDNFGPLIAYLLPGFVSLWGVSYFSETVHTWLAAAPQAAPTVGGFLYATLASTAAGLLVSAVRWAVVDRLYHRTGIREPRWDFSRLPEKFEAFEGLVQNHYRYFQFYANFLVALSFTYVARLIAVGFRAGHAAWTDFAFVLIWVVLVAASRDTLRKYYARTQALLH